MQQEAPMNRKLEILAMGLAATWLLAAAAPALAQSTTDKSGTSTAAKSDTMPAKMTMAKHQRHKHRSHAGAAPKVEYLRAAGSPPPGKGQQ
jgi:hypothetical protein